MTNIFTNAWIIAPTAMLFIGRLFAWCRFMSDDRRMKVIVGSSYVATAISLLITFLFIFNKPESVTLWAYNGLGLSFQVDSISLILLFMISFLSAVILTFSKTYLEGDSKHLNFMGRLSVTCASSMLLVSAGNIVTFFLAWVLTSITLHTLLVFYPERPRAQLSARKKFILARAGDIVLLAAFWLLYTTFNTGDFISIKAALGQMNTSNSSIEIIAILLGITAILKSAQIPFHGWLIEVMETPTPVSALLHAGILNAGPFLVIRFSDFFGLTSLSPLLLIVVGGLTAVYASTVLLTQPAIKTILGYSSAAHMGFMLFVCGLGGYSAALLHLVGHSFYKAYAFLTSGNAVAETKKSNSVALNSNTNTHRGALISMIFAIAIYLGIARVLHIPIFNDEYFYVGIVVLLGISTLFSSIINVKRSILRLSAASIMAVTVCLLFFKLEHIMHGLNHYVFSAPSADSSSILWTYAIILLLFSGVIWLQNAGFKPKRYSWSHTFYIHLRNGFYLNALFDRWVGALAQLKKEAR